MKRRVYIQWVHVEVIEGVDASRRETDSERKGLGSHAVDGKLLRAVWRPTRGTCTTVVSKQGLGQQPAS